MNSFDENNITAISLFDTLWETCIIVITYKGFLSEEHPFLPLKEKLSGLYALSPLQVDFPVTLQVLDLIFGSDVPKGSFTNSKRALRNLFKDKIILIVGLIAFHCQKLYTCSLQGTCR